MEALDEQEPVPLVPARCDGLCVHSQRYPQAAATPASADVNSGPQEKATAPLTSANLNFGPHEEALSRSVRPPAPRARDWSPPPPTERSMSVAKQSFDGRDASPSDALHAAVWLADLKRVDELLQAAADIDHKDAHGATPLLLAIRLLPRSPEYLGVIRHLLSKAANPRLRSSDGWSPLDEAISTGDKVLATLLFEEMQRSARQHWETRLSTLAWALDMLPDFECTIRWEFESPVLPLLSKIAPSDVVRLRKCGRSLRIDSTLASWKRLSFSKRRSFSTLFRGDTLAADGPARAGNGAGGGAGGGGPELSICTLNHTKGTVVDVAEGMDLEEVQVVVDDLMSADAMQWDMKLDEMEVTQATTWLGSTAGPCEVNGWKAWRFDVKGSVGVAVRKKGNRRSTMTFQGYFGRPLPADACLPEVRAEFAASASSPAVLREASDTSVPSECTENFDADKFGQALFARGLLEEEDDETMSIASEILGSWPDSQSQPLQKRDDHECARPSYPSLSARHLDAGKGHKASKPPGGEAGKAQARQASLKPGTGDKAGATSKSLSASVWLATGFPVPLQQFLPILDTLALEHDAIQRLKELIASQSFQQAMQSVRQESGPGHTFPVRASVPLNLAVRAVVHFEAFRLREARDLPPEVFEVPRDYQFMPRREAQKTLNRAKKRMLLANLTL